MKKQYSNIILLLVLLISGGAQADVFHYVGANVHGGEWTLWHPANLKYMDKSYGVGGGLGFQGWFKKNAHWGFDLNTFVKNDWKFSKDDNQWEWFWGAGLPLDINASIIYRF